MSTDRFASWAHWGISFWTGERGRGPRAIAEIFFQVGTQGPCDGFVGSPEREAYRAVCRAWTERGELPEGAACPIDAAWMYDPAYPGAEWIGGQWVSPVRIGHAWVFPESVAA